MKEALFKSLSIIQYVNRCSNKKGTLLTVRRVYWLKARQKHKNNKTNTSANTLGVRPPPLQPWRSFETGAGERHTSTYAAHTKHLFFSNGKYLLFSDLNSEFNPPKDWCVCVVWGNLHYYTLCPQVIRDQRLLTFNVYIKTTTLFFFTVWSCCIFRSFDTWRLEMYSIFLMAIQYSLQCSYPCIKCT